MVIQTEQFAGDISDYAGNDNYCETVADTLRVNELNTPSAESTAYCNCQTAEYDSESEVDRGCDGTSHVYAVKSSENNG